MAERMPMVRLAALHQGLSRSPRLSRGSELAATAGLPGRERVWR